jgi:uncharacterized protein (TIGR00369 family)
MERIEQIDEQPANQPDDRPTPGTVPAADGVTPASVDAFVTQTWPSLATPFRCVSVSGRQATIEMQVPASSLRPGRLISGPAQFGAADLVFWCACFGAIGLEAMALTSELSIRFLRPASGSVLWAEADLLSVGSRRIAGSVTVWTDTRDRPVSVAQGTYIIPETR